MGGLYSVTALWENDQERVTVYTKHGLKIHETPRTKASMQLDACNKGSIHDSP